MKTLVGTLTAPVTISTGTSKAGKEWRKGDMLVEEEGAQYTEPHALEVWGNILGEVEQIAPGSKLEIEFELKSRTFNGRTYTTLNLSKFSVVETKSQQPTAPAAVIPEAADFLAQKEAEDPLPF